MFDSIVKYTITAIVFVRASHLVEAKTACRCVRIVVREFHVRLRAESSRAEWIEIKCAAQPLLDAFVAQRTHLERERVGAGGEPLTPGRDWEGTVGDRRNERTDPLD